MKKHLFNNDLIAFNRYLPMIDIRMIMLVGCLFSCISLNASAISGLSQKQFKKYWMIESESPDYQLSFMGDTCEILSPKGLTLWRKEKMHSNMMVEYDVCVIDEGR